MVTTTTLLSMLLPQHPHCTPCSPPQKHTHILQGSMFPVLQPPYAFCCCLRSAVVPVCPLLLPHVAPGFVCHSRAMP